MIKVTHGLMSVFFSHRLRPMTSPLHYWPSRVVWSLELGRRSEFTKSGRKSFCGKWKIKFVILCSPEPTLIDIDTVLSQGFANLIRTLETQGCRILVGDIQESIHYAVYKAPENRLLVFADDTSPRWTTAMAMVDYDTVAVGDKFGNFFVNRLDKSVSDEVDDDPTGSNIMHEKGYLMGAPHKTHLIAHYHLGDIITSIQKVAMVAGGREVLVYTGLMGTVGVLAPFVSNEDVDFFSTLEMHLRTEAPSLVGTPFLPSLFSPRSPSFLTSLFHCLFNFFYLLCILTVSQLLGRDHLAYRSSYAPVKSVIDGDLCNQFALLSMQKQAQIAQELDRTTAEVLKKSETIAANSW